MPMSGGVYKKVTEVKRGGGTILETLYIIWDVETGEEKTFHFGIDAREYLRDYPDKYTAIPPASANPVLRQTIEEEMQETEEPVELPEIDESTYLPGRQMHGITSLPGADTSVLMKRGNVKRKKKVA